MLAAAALVKVMQRIFSGGVTEQQPDHAVDQHMGLPGTGIGRDEHRRSGSMRAAALHARRAGYCAALSFLVSMPPAGPFLDPRQIVITAIAVRPHGQVERPIGLASSSKLRISSSSLARASSRHHRAAAARRARDLQFKRPRFAGRIVAAEPDIDQFADGAPAAMPANPPSRRIAASSVSCGDRPMRTCLPVGGCPVL